MSFTFPVLEDLALTLSAGVEVHSLYPTASLQKGFLLHCRGQSLAEEAVGFGVPVLKYGLQVLFPGRVELKLEPSGPLRQIRAAFTLDRVERISRNSGTLLRSRPLYGLKDALAALLRRAPILREPLTGLSSALRDVFRWRTTYQPAGISARVEILYSLDPLAGTLQVSLEPDSLRRLTATELILMDEQGARCFDRFEDSTGAHISGREIGCWDEVRAPEAAFISSTKGIRFGVTQAAGARLYRGRELVGSRLAWAGFGHVLPLPADHLDYRLRLEKLP